MSERADSLRGLVHVTGRLLSFRASREDCLAIGPRHLAFGLLIAWACGVGRYWDHPSALAVQTLGLGSVIYVLALGTFLWIMAGLPGADDWSWLRVTGFVALTSPPALLYAIPVERFTELELARQLNLGFLAVVAAWRVALYLRFLRQLGRLNFIKLILASVLPLSLIVVALTLLNLEHVAFDVMGGLDHETPTDPNDLSYSVVFLLGLVSYFALPFTGVAWLVAVGLQVVKNLKSTPAGGDETSTGDGRSVEQGHFDGEA